MEKFDYRVYRRRFDVCQRLCVSLCEFMVGWIGSYGVKHSCFWNALAAIREHNTACMGSKRSLCPDSD
jgi:hypothetical protein